MRSAQILPLLGLFAGACSVGAQTGPSTQPSGNASAKAPHKITEAGGITEYRLDNGLRVLLFPDATQERITTNITYFVGSRHEGYGEAGMAHLLEHMVFKGTPTTPDIWKALKQRGADFNGTTWLDRTNYYETLPASDDNLTFALTLEADRMVNSLIAESELKKEFSVVRNEFERGENSPERVLMQRMTAAAFEWHNYGRSTIGNKSDIESVPVHRLRAFYKKYYQPDNALLIVAGKFDQELALKLIAKNFGAIPRPERKLDPTYTTEPSQDGERVVTLRRSGDVHVVGLFYHTVPGAHEDALAVAGALHTLTDEPAGRLYKKLVEPGLASSVNSVIFPTKEPGFALIVAEVAEGKSPQRVEKILVETVESFGDEMVSDKEFQRFINRRKKQHRLAMANTKGIAVALTEYAAMGDWRLLFLERDRLDQLTPKAIQRVAKQRFIRANRTLGRFVPTPKPVRAPVADIPNIASLVAKYTGGKKINTGSPFTASLANIEARTRWLTLDSGMKVALLEKSTRGDTVKAKLTLNFGNAQSLKGYRAAALLLPQLLLRGTKTHSYQNLLDEFDRLKAKVYFSNNPMQIVPGKTNINIETVRENFAEVLSLVAHILKEPSFPAEQFETLKSERVAALQKGLSDPMTRGLTYILRNARKVTKDNIRYVPTLEEAIAEIKAVSRQQLIELHSKQWGAAHASIAIVGSFESDSSIDLLKREFGPWRAKTSYKRVVSGKYQRSTSVDHIIKTADKPMALVAVAQTVQLRDDHADYAAAKILGYILVGNPASRLMTRLRHKGGISYTTFGTLEASKFDDTGAFFAAAIVNPKNAQKALEGTLDEISKVRSTRISTKELQDGVSSYIKSFQQRLADDGAITGLLSQWLESGRRPSFSASIHDKMRALTPKDILRVAKRYLQPSQLVKVRAGAL